jgi:hypothetical protein
MSPSIDHLIDHEWLKSFWPLRNNDASTAFIEFAIEPVAIKGLVCEQVLKIDAVDPWWNADRIVAVAKQEDEADKIAECIGQREDFGRPAAFGFADGLILSPPFAPCP